MEFGDWQVECEETCGGCPSAWEGKAISPEGDEYDLDIHFRYGYLRISLDRRRFFGESISDGMDGVISWDKVVPYLRSALRRKEESLR